MSKRHSAACPILPHLYAVYIYCWTCFRE